MLRSPASVPGVTSWSWRPAVPVAPARGRVLLSCFLSRVQEDRESCWLVVCSALALLVAQVLADHHDPAVTADHLALVADLLDARLNLHSLALRFDLVLPARMGRQVWRDGAGGAFSAVAEDDPATGQVVRAELHHHAVLREDPDVVLAHLARDVSENLVTVGQLNPEHRVRESLDDRALDLDDTVLLGHILHNLLRVAPCWGAHTNTAREVAHRQMSLRQDALSTKSCSGPLRHAQPRGAYAAPAASSRSLPPSRAVSTHRPSSVTATVFSQWAARDESVVTTVQSSWSTRVSADPSVTIGSIATVTPDRTVGPRSRTR